MGKNLIFQYWKGESLPMTESFCVPLMEEYAKRIGVDYIFRDNPDFIKTDKPDWVSRHYNCFEPCFNPELYETYDNILYVDCDIGVPEHIDDNIFEIAGNDFDVAMSREIEQEEVRLIQKTFGLCPLETEKKENLDLSIKRVDYYSDEMWIDLVEDFYSIEIPRNDDQCKKLYNSGVVLYTQTGLSKARENWSSIDEYLEVVDPMRPIDFYLADQEYLITMIQKSHMKIHELDNEWNSRVCDYGPLHDCRTPESKFIHIQQRNVTKNELEELVS